MTRLSLALALTICIPLASADHHKTAKVGHAGPDGWITMFNGEDLTGWKANQENPDAFSVKDGAIKVAGERGHLFYVGTNERGETAKTLDKPFRDFHFKGMVKTEPGANSGIYFHTRYQDEGWPTGGFEAQVNATHGDPKKSGSLYAVENVMEAPHKDNEWFPYEIRVEGDQVTITVNGKQTVQWTQPKEAQPGDRFDRVLGAGTIALQAHDPGSVVHFKDMKIKRLNYTARGHQ